MYSDISSAYNAATRLSVTRSLAEEHMIASAIGEVNTNVGPVV